MENQRLMNKKIKNEAEYEGNNFRKKRLTRAFNTAHSENSHCEDNYATLNRLLALHYKALSGKHFYVKPLNKYNEEQKIHPIEPQRNISQIRLAKASFVKTSKNLNLKGMYSKFITLCTPKSPSRRWKRQNYLKCVQKHRPIQTELEYKKSEKHTKMKCPVSHLPVDENKSCKEVRQARKSYEYDVTNKLTEEYYIRLLSPSEISLFEECLMRSELTDEYLLNLIKSMLDKDGVIDKIIDIPAIKDFVFLNSNEQLASLLIEKLGNNSLLPDEYLGSFGKYVKQRLADIFKRLENSVFSENASDSLWNISKTQEASASSDSLLEKRLKDMSNYPETLDKFGCRLETYSSLNKKESVCNMLRRLNKYKLKNLKHKTPCVRDLITGINKSKELHSIQLDRCTAKQHEEIFDRYISKPVKKYYLPWGAILSELCKPEIKEIFEDTKFEEVSSTENVKNSGKNEESKYNLINELVDKISNTCGIKDLMENKAENNTNVKDKKSKAHYDGRMSFKDENFVNFMSFHKFLQNEDITALHSYEKKLHLKPVSTEDSRCKLLLDSVMSEVEDVFLELDATKHAQDWDDLLSSVGSADAGDVEDVQSTNGSEDHLVLDLDEYKTFEGMEIANKEEIIENGSSEESITLGSADLQDVEDLFKKEDLDWLPYNLFEDPEFVIHKDEDTSSSSTSYDSVFTFPSCESDNKDKKTLELCEINDSNDTTTTESDSTPHGPEESSTDQDDEWIPKGIKYDTTVKRAMQDKVWKLSEEQTRIAEEYLENMKRKGQVKNKEEEEMTQALPWGPYIGVNEERGENTYNYMTESPVSPKDKYGEQLIEDIEKIYETYDFYDTACRTVPLQVLKNIYALSELKGEDAIIARYAMNLCMTNDLDKLHEIAGQDLKVYAPVVQLVKNLLDSLHHPNFLYNDVLLKIPPPPHNEKVHNIVSDASLIPHIRQLKTDKKGLKKRMKLTLRLMKKDNSKALEKEKASNIGEKLHKCRKQNAKAPNKNINLKVPNKSEGPKTWQDTLGTKKKTFNEFMFSKNYENEKFSEPEEWSWSEGDSEIPFTKNFKENVIQSIEEEFPIEGIEFLELLDIDTYDKKSEPSVLCFDGKVNIGRKGPKCNSQDQKIQKKGTLRFDGSGHNKTFSENDWSDIYKEVGVLNNTNRMEFLRLAYPENYEYLKEKANRKKGYQNNVQRKKKESIDAKHEVLPIVPLYLKRKERVKRLSKLIGLVVRDSEIKTCVQKNNYPFGSKTNRGLDPIKKRKAERITPKVDLPEEKELQDYVEEDYPRTEEIENFFYKLMTFYNPEKALKYLRNKTGEQKNYEDLTQDLNDGLAKKNNIWYKKYCKLLEEQTYKPSKSYDAEVKQKYFPWKTKDVSPVIPGTNVQISEPQIKDLYEVEDAWGYSLPPLDYRTCGLSPEALDAVLSRMLDQDIKAVELAGIDYEKEFKKLQAQIEKGLFKTPTHYVLKPGRLNVPKEQTHIPAPWHYIVPRWPESRKQGKLVNNLRKKETNHMEATLKIKKHQKPIKITKESHKEVKKPLGRGFKKSDGAIYKGLSEDNVFCIFCTFPVKPNYYYVIGNYAICYECFKTQRVPLEDYMERRGLYNVKAVRPGYKKVKSVRTSRVEAAKPLKDVHDYKWKSELFINRFVNSYYFGGFIPNVIVFKASKHNTMYKKFKDLKISQRENTRGEIIDYYKENLMNLKRKKNCPSVPSIKKHEPGAGIKLWRNSSTKPL